MAQVTAVTRLHSLAQELPHAVAATKKKKKDLGVQPALCDYTALGVALGGQLSRPGGGTAWGAGACTPVWQWSLGDGS